MATTSNDVSETLVSATLIQEQHDPTWPDSLTATWHDLQTRRENLARYISIVGLRASPNDTATQQIIARSLIGLIHLLDESDSQTEVDGIWHSTETDSQQTSAFDVAA